MASMEALAVKLRTVWREIREAEAARGDALRDGGDAQAAQRAYEAALERFRHIQIEIFNVVLGYIPIILELVKGQKELIAAHEARITALERMISTDPERSMPR